MTSGDLVGTHWRNRCTGTHVEVVGAAQSDCAGKPVAYVRSSTGRHFFISTTRLGSSYARVVNS